MDWYEDNDLRIVFNPIPDIDIREITPDMTPWQKHIICKYPFFNKNDVEVKLYDFRNRITREHIFVIPKRYAYDGATIPKVAWSLIGISNTSPEVLIPSLVHDVLCKEHSLVNNDRYFSTLVFERLLYVAGVPAYKRWIMKHCVDNYQKFLWD